MPEEVRVVEGEEKGRQGQGEGGRPGLPLFQGTLRILYYLVGRTARPDLMQSEQT